MPAIQFSGLASGLDTDSIISAVMAVERIPLQRLEANNGDMRDQISILNKLESSLSSLSSKAEALGTTENFLSYAGTTTDDSVAKITASGDSIRGTYDLVVNNLATAQRNYSTQYDSADSEVTASDDTLSFTINGETTDITVTAGTTLEELAAAINSSGAEVNAGLLFDGSKYRLQVSGSGTGAENAVTFSEGSMALDFASNEASAAADASFTLDGFSMTSSSNLVASALPGVSLELLDASEAGETVSLKIAPDTDAVKNKLKEFVSAYNSVMSIVNAQVGEGKGSNTLNGDSTVRTIEQQLSSLLSSPMSGLTDSEGNGLALASIGFKTNTDGTISLDDDDLTEALTSDFDEVARYFVGDPTTNIDGMSNLMEDLVDSMVSDADALLDTRRDGINSIIKSNEDRIENQQRYLDSYEEQLRAQYTLLEQTMAQLQNQGNFLAQFL